MKKLFKNKKGFTLVELMVVVAIIGILTAIAIPVYNSVTTKAEQKACDANVRTLMAAAETYKMENDAYPANLAALDKFIKDPGGKATGSAADIKCPTTKAPYTYNLVAAANGNPESYTIVCTAGNNKPAHAFRG